MYVSSIMHGWGLEWTPKTSYWEGAYIEENPGSFPERLESGWPLPIVETETNRGLQEYIWKGTFLGWLFSWARCASTREFCPALATLVGPIQNIFSSLYIVFFPIVQQAGQFSSCYFTNLFLRMCQTCSLIKPPGSLHIHTGDFATHWIH